MTLWDGNCYQLNFTDEEMEAQNLGSLIPETVLLPTVLCCPKVSLQEWMNKQEWIHMWELLYYFPEVIFLEGLGYIEKFFYWFRLWVELVM